MQDLLLRPSAAKKVARQFLHGTGAAVARSRLSKNARSEQPNHEKGPLMKRLTTTLNVPLLSACLRARAIAQDQPTRSSPAAPNPNKAQKAPSRSDVQQQQAEPSTERMDANAQRAHTRSRGSTPSGSASHASTGEVRDWRAIDKNHDNLIEPDEMEAALNAGKPHASTSNGTESTSSNSTGAGFTSSSKQ